MMTSHCQNFGGAGEVDGTDYNVRFWPGLFANSPNPTSNSSHLLATRITDLETI